MRKIKTHNFLRRFITVILCLGMLGNIGVVRVNALESGSGGTNGVTRQADPSTMDDYLEMLDFSNNTRYAGRVWSDKSVFALGYPDSGDRSSYWNKDTGVLTLTADLDGISDNKSIQLDEDFLHVYSTLGSSLEVIGVPPVRAVIIFDNSGSMYNSYSGALDEGETLWGRQRIALTVEAINRAIDTLMEASVYNEVSVVLFGDGEDPTNSDKNSTHVYQGNSTAVTILPMKHYDPLPVEQRSGKNPAKKDEGYTPYLVAGWDDGKDTSFNGAHPFQTAEKPITGGWVFVNNEIAELKSDNKEDTDNPGHAWYKDGVAWNGWNNCGNSTYTAYKNGTTNIQAGYYVGMQELMNAEKIERIGNQFYQCVPSLVMLTDGQATDMMTGNYVTPLIADDSTYPSARGFVNDTGNRLRSFTGVTNANNGKEIGNFWDMFVETNEESGKLQSVAWEFTNKKNTDEAPLSGNALTEMKRVANTYSDSVAAMLLGTLMTTAYYKAAVKNAYNVEGNWNIYTISVDMVDLGTLTDDSTVKGAVEESDHQLPKTWAYHINCNAPTMDPSEYFYHDDKVDIGWLVDKGYIDGMTKEDLAKAIEGDADVDISGQTVYPDWAVGEMLIQGIVTAAQELKRWEKGNSFDLRYQSWNEAKGILQHLTGKAEIDPAGEYYSQWDTTRYVNPWTHTNGYLLKELQTIPYHSLSGGGDNPAKLTNKDVMANIGYNNFAYYAETANGSASELANAFVEIIDSITEHLFAPVGGTNDLGTGDAMTYVDPMGKYMDLKDVKYVTLFGSLYGVSKAAIYDYQWNHQYMEEVKHDGNAPLDEGWYRGEANAEAEYLAATPPDKTTADMWNDGWVYRVSYSNASKYVPTLDNINTDVADPEQNAILDKMRHTTYTFYRISSKDGTPLTDKERDTLHMNVAYGSDDDIPDKVTYDGDKQQHLKTKGVYALSDLRIWVENSGDYSPDLGNTETDTNYDEALWINIPVNMLPLRTTSVNLGDTYEGSDDTWTYTTNLTKGSAGHPASYPLRVFYTVGVSSSVLDDSNRIKIGDLDAEYIIDNKATTALAATARNVPRGTVEFFANWYNPLNRYNDYATTTTDYTFGDPVTSFSPGNSNRYYIFEKALPLFSAAYQYEVTDDSATWKKVAVADGNTATGFGGDLLAQIKTSDITVNSPDGVATNDEINAALGKISAPSPKDGDIVLLEKDLLTNVYKPEGDEADPFPSSGYFFLAIEYYDLNQSQGSAKWQQYVITRKGSEFGSAYGSAHITNGDMLVWHDISGTNTKDYPYLSFTETNEAGTPDRSRGKDYIGKTNIYLDEEAGTLRQPATDCDVDPDFQAGGTWVVSAKPGGLRVGGLAQAVKNKGGAYTGGGDIQTFYSEQRYPTETKEKNLSWGFYGNNVTRTANNYYMPTISSASDAEKNKIIVNVYQGNNGRLIVEDTTLLATKLVEPPIITDDGEEVYPEEAFNFQIYIAGKLGKQSAVVVKYKEGEEGQPGTWQRQFHYIDLILDGKLFLQSKDGLKIMTDDEGCRIVPNGDEYVYAEKCLSSSGRAHEAGEKYEGTRYFVYIGKNSSRTENGSSDLIFRVYHNEEVDDYTVDSNDVTIKSEGEGTEGTFYADRVYLVSEDKYNTLWTDPDNPIDPVRDDFNINEGNLWDIKLEDPNGAFKFLTINPDGVSDTSTDITFTSDYLTASAYWTKEIVFGVNSNPDGDGKDVTNQELTADDLYDKTKPADPDLFPASLTNDRIARNTAEFTLKHGEALLFNSIVSGSAYRITEKLTPEQQAAGYSLKEVNGAAGIESDTGAYSVFGSTNLTEKSARYINTYEYGSFSITKKLDAQDGVVIKDEDRESRFDFTLKLEQTALSGFPVPGNLKYIITGPGVDESVSGILPTYDPYGSNDPDVNGIRAVGENAWDLKLRGDQTFTIEDLPLETGYNYTISESYPGGFEVSEASGGSDVDGLYTVTGTVKNGDHDSSHVTFTNTKKVLTPTSIALNLHKSINDLTGGSFTWDEKTSFDFKVVPSEDNPAQDPIKSIPGYDETSHTLTVTAKGPHPDNQADVAIFDGISFPSEGIYKYTITEVVSDKPGITTDNKIYTVTIEVTEDRDPDTKVSLGTLSYKTTISYSEGGVLHEDVGDIVFENDYDTAKITVPLKARKIYGGTLKKGLFAFELTGVSATYDEISFKSEKAPEIFSEPEEDEPSIKEAEVLTLDEEAELPPKEESAPEADEILPSEDSETKEVLPSEVPEEDIIQDEEIPQEDEPSFEVSELPANEGDLIEEEETDYGIMLLAAPPKPDYEEVPSISGDESGPWIQRNTEDGWIDFGSITFNDTGTYVYTLKEAAGTSGHVIYDKAVYKITIIIKSSAGKLYVEDIKYEVSPEGDGTYIAYEAEDVPTFTNELQSGNLEVHKTVTGLIDPDKEFDFKVTLTPFDELTDAKIVKYDASGKALSDSFTIEADGTLKFKLKHNEYLAITNLPINVHYEVIEEDYTKSGYTTSKVDDTGTIAKDVTSKAEFTNDRPIVPPPPEMGHGHLSIQKNVSGTGADYAKAWHFHITLSKPLNDQYTDITFVNGEADVYLKNGQTARALNLPEGITYKVEEVDPEISEYEVTSSNAEGDIKGGETAEVTFNNHKDKEESPPHEDPPDDPDDPSDEPKDDTPNTGDENHLNFWMISLISSLVGVLMSAYALFDDKRQHLRK